MLICGIGGIGCEFLNIISNKIKIDITICDYDLVELSNLSRSCIFKDKDINKPKVLVAKNFIKNKYGISINTIQDKIENINLQELEKFHIFIMCFDNIVSRRYLNKILYENFNNFILIDSGSEGFNSHIKVIKPFEDPCIDCNFELYKNDENINLCTIKNLPRNIEDCIIYYKDSKENDIFNLVKLRAKQFKIDTSTLDKFYIKKVLENIIITFQSTNKMISALLSKIFIKILSGNKLENNYFMIYNENSFAINKLNWLINKDCLICSKNIYKIKIYKDMPISVFVKNITIKEKFSILDYVENIVYTNGNLINKDIKISDLKYITTKTKKYIIKYL